MSRKIYQEFTSANILGVTVEHNGFQNGDAGHGGYVKITFDNVDCTRMELNGEECNSVELTFRGDTERETLLSALETIVQELKNNPWVEHTEQPRGAETGRTAEKLQLRK